MPVNQLSKFPKYSLYLVADKFNSLNERQQEALNLTDFKNPFVTLALGLFLGVIGADRFYIGSIGIGALKALALFFIFAAIGIIEAVYEGKAMSDNEYIIALGIAGFVLMFYFVFAVVDAFLSFKACKEKNLQILVEILEIYK
nr:TM2 domain-containing protein [uncultured Campylobacter sp.]